MSFDNAVLEAIAGGWQTGAILTISSGNPEETGGGCETFGGGGRPDATGVNPNSGPKTAQAFWAKKADGRQAFAFCPEGNALAYRYGNIARNVHIGPGYGNLDFQIAKTFAINETMGLEFKFESFNFTNHPQWNLPSDSFRNPNYGVITSARQMRTNQFALKFNF